MPKVPSEGVETSKNEAGMVIRGVHIERWPKKPREDVNRPPRGSSEKRQIARFLVFSQILRVRRHAHLFQVGLERSTDLR